MDRVALDTDTAFDADGVPVSIRRGMRARVVVVEGNFVQVVIWWAGGGPEILGVPTQFVHSLELVHV